MSDDAPTQNALQNVIAQAEKADSGSDGCRRCICGNRIIAEISAAHCATASGITPVRRLAESGWCGCFPRFCVMMMMASIIW